MTTLNIAEWSPDQVAGWISGLGTPVARYVPAMRDRGLNGAKLLTLRCDDLEYLGIHVIGHQELLLEAVEHLRNFQYEADRECVQALAVRVSGVATSLARALRAAPEARLPTQALADLAAMVRAVKPLACWLGRWAAWSGGGASERAAALLKVSLEAAACAQRERFAEHPARTVAACAAATAAAADYIVQEVLDPTVLQPARLDLVSLRQGARPLGFEVVPSFCGHHQLARIRFGSPAHTSGLVHDADEIIQVGGQCVIGWSGSAVMSACSAAARAGAGELSLRLRRRGARAPPALPTRPAARLRLPPNHHYHYDRLPQTLTLPQHYLRREPIEGVSAAARGGAGGAGAGGAGAGGAGAGGAGGAGGTASSSDESDPLSPPASPTHHTVHSDHTRLYGPRPRPPAPQRRHSVCGGSPLAPRPALALHQLWAEVVAARGAGGAAGATGGVPVGAGGADPDDCTLYRRDKAVSYSTGLELSPRPQTCLGVLSRAPLAPPLLDADKARGKLDKSHSTPAYELEGAGNEEGGSLQNIAIPESPPADPRPGGDLLETVNVVVSAGGQEEPERNVSMRRSPPTPPPRPPNPRPTPREFPVLRPVPRSNSPEPKNSPLKKIKPVRGGEPPQISVPLRHITQHDLQVPGERRAPPTPAPQGADDDVPPDPVGPSPPRPGPVSPTSAVRAMFPNSKTKGLKKKNSMLARRRCVQAREVWAVGVGGGVWQRVRPRAADPRWARRHLLLADSLLYAYRTPHCAKAECMIYLEGFTVCGAGEVRSRDHAFKVYHTGTAFYFAADSRDAMRAWVQLIHRATLQPPIHRHQLDVSSQYSETDYSETESEIESTENKESKEKDRDADKDKSKFGSLKKLRQRAVRSESAENVSQASTSLDRKYLRFFSRARKDDGKGKNKQPGVPVPTEHYRSYRRVAPADRPAPPAPLELRRNIPSPINYIHASNPNLLDFEKSDFITKPILQVKRAKPQKLEAGVGLVTLEQLMLQEQAERRAAPSAVRPHLRQDLASRLERIVPDVIYGEVPHAQGRSLPPVPLVAPPAAPPAASLAAPLSAASLPHSVTGKDGYEKIVYSDEKSPCLGSHLSPERAWRDSLRRNDKVAARGAGQGVLHHRSGGSAEGAGGAGVAGGVSRLRLMFARAPPERASESWGWRTGAASGAGAAAGGASGAAQYPHLQCPPTFQPETYSLYKPDPDPL